MSGDAAGVRARATTEHDVIVIGGGAAGVGAAVGAAQSGARTLLVEREPYLGGAATACGVLTYCGFWTQAHPPAQIVRGVGERVLRALARLDAYAGPTRMDRSGVVVALLDPESVKLALDRVCADVGVDVLLHATLIAADRVEGRPDVGSVTLWDHGGTRRCIARAFVDASGEADLAARVGVATRYGSPTGHVQNATLALRFGGIAPDADIRRTTWAQAIREAKARGVAPLTKEESLVARLPISGDVVAYLADEAVDARDARSLTAAEQHGRAQAWAYLEAIRRLPGHERAHLVSSGPRLGVRESRHVITEHRLTAAEVLDGARCTDAVALGGWPVELHPAPGEPSVWRRIRDDGAYEIPLRAVVSRDAPNLFAAGRTMDAETEAFASLRVMGTAFATGHAAGVAAATRALGGVVSAERVRAELRRQEALVELGAPVAGGATAEVAGKTITERVPARADGNVTGRIVAGARDDRQGAAAR